MSPAGRRCTSCWSSSPRVNLSRTWGIWRISPSFKWLWYPLRWITCWKWGCKSTSWHWRMEIVRSSPGCRNLDWSYWNSTQKCRLALNPGLQNVQREKLQRTKNRLHQNLNKLFVKFKTSKEMNEKIWAVAETSLPHRLKIALLEILQ